jgi:hypothetical protein
MVEGGKAIIITNFFVIFLSLHSSYQANTVMTKRVLLFHYLGFLGFVDKRFILLCEQYETTELNLRTMIADNFND